MFASFSPRFYSAFVVLLAIPFVQLNAQRHPDLCGRQHDRALCRFVASVNEYVALHRRLEEMLPPQRVSPNYEEIRQAVDALAVAIRTARPDARPGNIFSPEVAELIRCRIEMTFREYNYDPVDLLADISEERLPHAKPPVVNRPFDWRLGAAMWPGFLWTLPALPDELQYRFVGRDLILLDVHANLVVDILKDAIPIRAQTSSLNARPNATAD